jgi:hypothetical protein
MIKDAGQFKLMIERVQSPVAARGTLQTYAVARAEGTATGRVLALLPAADATTLEVDSTHCIPLDAKLSAEVALHVPALALSLWAWDQMQLEIGEAAVYTAESPFQHFLGEAALLRGALPVIQLGSSSTYLAPPHVQVLDAGESSALLTELKGRLADCVGVAAIDLSGKAEVTDVIFETLPRWGRLLLAAHQPAPINIDFYNNVHRKGIDMRGCSLDPLQVFDPALRATYDAFVQRAVALLTRRPELVLAKRT